jgi:anthranilate synthase component 1
VRAWLARQRVAPVPAALRFGGGLAGYFGYEAVRNIEKKALGKEKPDPLGTPDMLLLVSDELAVVDNVLGKLYLVVYADPQQPEALRVAKERLQRLRARLAQPLPRVTVLEDFVDAKELEPERSVTEPQFLEAVRHCKEYILAGDVMQVQISQRSSRTFSASPLSLYRSLRGVNPSPYMYYFDFGDHHVVGASPEILVRLSGGTVTLRPIAGTRPRGATPQEDAARAEELLADPKERAEHVMLIDLGRNDVGRVAKAGSVRVTDRMVIERYSHVMHIVSNVEGRAADGLDAVDVLKATFPAGTVTGAPKVRAMQIIDELEPVKRGVYSGAVGYLGFNGDMDVAIGIRTAVVKDGMLHVQAAAGIVADSDPRSEWEETKHKTRAILKAAARCS